YIFLGTFSFFLLFHLSKNRLNHLLYLASMVFYAVMIILSSSRAGLIIFVAVNVVYWMYIGMMKSPGFIKSTVILAVTFLVSWTYINYLVTYLMEETNIGFR